MRHSIPDPVEQQADALLRGFAGKASGIYCEEQLARHRRREFTNQNEEATLLLAIAHHELLTLMQDDLRRLGTLARLSEHQTLIWSYFLDGLSETEISRLQGVSRQAVSDCVIRCRQHVEETMATHPWFGLWDVYWELLSRGKRR